MYSRFFGSARSSLLMSVRMVPGSTELHRMPCLPRAMAQDCIRCNSVLPGTILTDINKDDLADPKKREYMEGRIPLGRLGQPEDIGGAVAFLASDMAA